MSANVCSGWFRKSTIVIEDLVLNLMLEQVGLLAEFDESKNFMQKDLLP